MTPAQEALILSYAVSFGLTGYTYVVEVTEEMFFTQCRAFKTPGHQESDGIWWEEIGGAGMKKIIGFVPDDQNHAVESEQMNVSGTVDVRCPYCDNMINDVEIDLTKSYLSTAIVPDYYKIIKHDVPTCKKTFAVRMRFYVQSERHVVKIDEN